MARKTDHRLDFSKGVRGEDRKRFFEQPGATPTGWMGGPRTVTIDKKKGASKNACRGKVRW